MKTRKKENWGSQLGVILAVAGSAIGLGNFLRFPGQVATHGGAFMIPYFISFLLLAIPLSWSEWALGRYGGRCGFNSAAGIFSLAAKGRKRWAYVGAFGAYLPICISMYYLFIEAWCLAFAIQYFTGVLATLGLNVPSFLPGAGGPGLFLGSGEAYSKFFAAFVGANADGSIYRNADRVFAFTPLLGCSLFCLFLNYFLIYRGITKGIEAFCKVAMPLLLLCSLVVLFRVLTLPDPGIPGRSFLDGLGFMWNPSKPGVTIWNALSNPELWVAATSQIFFSVSVGFGLIVTYSSYVRETDDVALSGLTATVSNEFCEVVVAGLMIIPPAVMFLGVQGVEGNLDTFSLGFNVLPNVFEKMPFGQFFGFIFFALLFLAAVTSSLSQVQPSVALLEEGLAYGRKLSVLISAVFSTVGILILCHYSKQMFALDTFDFWVGNFGIILFAIFQTYLIAWIWGTPRMMRELTGGARIRVPFFIGPLLKYASLPYLLIISGFWLYQNSWDRLLTIAREPLAQMIVAFLLLTALFYGYVTWKTLRRWKAEGKDLVEISRKSDENWALENKKQK